MSKLYNVHENITLCGYRFTYVDFGYICHKVHIVCGNPDSYQIMYVYDVICGTKKTIAYKSTVHRLRGCAFTFSDKLLPREEVETILLEIIHSIDFKIEPYPI